MNIQIFILPDVPTVASLPIDDPVGAVRRVTANNRQYLCTARDMQTPRQWLLWDGVEISTDASSGYGDGLGGIIRVTPIEETSGTIVVDASLTDIAVAYVEDAMTIGTPLNPSDGKRLTYRLIQGNGGNHVIALSSIFQLAFGASIAFGADEGDVTEIEAIYNDAIGRWSVSRSSLFGTSGSTPPSISNPVEEVIAGIGANFQVEGGGFPLYAALYKAGVQQGSRYLVSSAGPVFMIPLSGGVFTARLYSASSGGTLLSQADPFTVTVHGTIDGPTIAAVVDQSSPYDVTADVFPVYAVLYKSGADEGARTIVNEAGSIALTPTTTGVHTARLYSAATGGLLIDETDVFTPFVLDFTISPTGLPGVAYTGASGLVTLTTTNQAVPWIAVSNDPSWMEISAGTSSGTGNGTTGYLIYPNAGAARTGTMTIAGEVFTVAQAAVNSGPRFYGNSQSDSPLDAEIITFQRDVIESMALTHTFEGLSDEYIQFAYPASLGLLTSIYYNGNLVTNHLGDFTLVVGTDPGGNPDIAYNRYHSTASLSGDLTVQFG